MINGYPREPSVRQGDQLVLHIATSSPHFRVEFYRMGSTLDFVDSAEWTDGQTGGPAAPGVDWGWNSHAFTVPGTWRSGVYIAMLFELDSEGNDVGAAPDVTTPDGRDSKALFVVTSANPGQDACILYKVPLFTYHAYNETTPGASLYSGASTVSFRRPGGGTGGTPWDSWAPDALDPRMPASPRQTFMHWDAPFIQWLEANGYAVDYCTDLDVHENPDGFLGSYNLLLSVGHDEYWSEEMRSSVEAFITGGGNVAFFSGNTCWWKVHVTDHSMSCNKMPPPGETEAFDQWIRTRAETSLTGVSYRHGGGWWDGVREAVGYTVQHAGHWIYANTGMVDGGVFGAPEHLVGYECDGAALASSSGPQGFLDALHTDGTPSSFVVLGVGKLTGWEDQQGGIGAAATMGIYTRGGTVFTGATTDWARVLFVDEEPTVGQITTNVLTKLSARSVRVFGTSPLVCSTFTSVEGGLATFHVDTASLVHTGPLTYTWSTSSGVAGASTGPTFQATMPSPPASVTVTVSIDDGSHCRAFGSLTFTPLTQVEYQSATLICELRNFIRSVARVRRTVVGIGEGNSVLVDPLWDPPKDRGLRAFTATELAGLRRSAARLVEVVERLEVLGRR